MSQEKSTEEFVMVAGAPSANSEGSIDTQGVVLADDEGTASSKGAMQMFEPLLDQIHNWSKQIAPHLETCGAGMDKAMALVNAAIAATLTEYSKKIEPLVAKGGDEVKKAAAPVYEALQQLLAKLEPFIAKLEPFTAPATTAVQTGTAAAVDAIKGLLAKLAPLADQAKVHVLEWNTTQLQPWMAHTGAAIKVSSVAALETARVQSAAAARATEEFYTTQLQPWAAHTGEQLKVHAAAAAKSVEVWNDTQLQPFIAAKIAPVATEWWMETLRCFCVPLAGIVAMAGLKEQAGQLHALAPEKIAAGGDYPAAANPPPTEPAAA